ncbi:unnamed protein product [Sympodiomycopsis kandeliae]
MHLSLSYAILLLYIGICTCAVHGSAQPVAHRDGNHPHFRQSHHESAAFENVFSRGIVQSTIKKVANCCGGHSKADAKPSSSHSASHSANHGSLPQTHHDSVPSPPHTAFSSTATSLQQAYPPAEHGAPARYDSAGKYEHPDAKSRLTRMRPGRNTPWYKSSASVREMKKMNFQPSDLSRSSSAESSLRSPINSHPASPEHGQGRGKEAASSNSQSGTPSNAEGPSGSKRP